MRDLLKSPSTTNGSSQVDTNFPKEPEINIVNLRTLDQFHFSSSPDKLILQSIEEARNPEVMGTVSLARGRTPKKLRSY